MKNLFLSLVILLFIVYCGDLSAQWQPTGLLNVQDTCKNICAIATNGVNIFAGTANGKVYRSTDSGNNWANVISLSTSNNILKIYALGVNGDYVFIGTDGGVYLSKDNGDNWSQALSINKTVYSLAIDGSNIYAGTNKGLYLSANNGISWKQVDNILNNSRILTLGLSNSNILAGVGSTVGGIYLSSDNGNNWESLLNLNNGVTSIAVSGTNIFAGTELGGVYLSTNGGGNWSQANVGVVYSSVWSVAISGNIIFSATEYGGVYVSTDFGNSWAMESDALIFKNVTSLAINNQYVFVGTLNNGLWSRHITEYTQRITSIENKNSLNIPFDYNLEQNYPNPFNPVTKIKYSVPKAAVVNISVYDVLGREIMNLVDEEKQPGTYETKFDGSSISSGIYFYRMYTGNFIATKKVILLK